MTSEIQKVGQTQVNQAAPQDPPKGKLKYEKRLEIRDAMRIADVRANGSSAQKLVAKAFEDCELDQNDNIRYLGTYNKDGAKAMNNYTFALDGNELRAYNNKTDCNVTIKANSQKELKDFASLIRDSEDLKGGNIVYDFKTKTASIDGVSGFRFDVCDMKDGKINTFNIKNSSLEYIDASYFTGNLNIKNTKDVGMIWDSKTKLYLDDDPNKRPVLNIDNASEVKIE